MTAVNTHGFTRPQISPICVPSPGVHDQPDCWYHDGPSTGCVKKYPVAWGKTLYSDHCGSVYEGPNQSFLISYARAENRLEVVFDIQYASQGCNTSWNAFPIPFENLSFE